MCTTFKKIKNKKHTPLFWDATNPLIIFHLSHPPPSRPPPCHLVAASTSAAWPKDSSPRKRLRHLKSGASTSMDGVVVEQPASALPGGSPWTTSGRANIPTKYTKMLVYIYLGLPQTYMFRGFLWYIIWVLGGQSLYFSWFWWLMVGIHIDTLLGTNISPPKGTFIWVDDFPFPKEGLC